jgi:hypothetical protein
MLEWFILMQEKREKKAQDNNRVAGYHPAL